MKKVISEFQVTKMLYGNFSKRTHEELRKFIESEEKFQDFFSYLHYIYLKYRNPYFFEFYFHKSRLDSGAYNILKIKQYLQNKNYQIDLMKTIIILEMEYFDIISGDIKKLNYRNIDGSLQKIVEKYYYFSKDEYSYPYNISKPEKDKRNIINTMLFEVLKNKDRKVSSSAIQVLINKMVKEKNNVFQKKMNDQNKERERRREYLNERKKWDVYFNKPHYERIPIPQENKWFVFRRDGFKCQICKRTVMDEGVILEIDHILPVSKGGINELSNLQTLCRDCNRSKGNRIE